LKKEKGDLFFIKELQSEIDRIDSEFENHRMEFLMVQALINGREYLEKHHFEHSDFEEIDTNELFDVMNSSSSAFLHRTRRNAALYEAATLILNLRRSVKSGDWAAIRFWLQQCQERDISLASEANWEIAELQKLSSKNLLLHSLMKDACSSFCISGTYMKLNKSDVGIAKLLSSLRVASTAPIISIDDKMLVYSGEKLKNLRIALLMDDYRSLSDEINNTDFTFINGLCVNEFLLVKKAIEFYRALNRISHFLTNEGITGDTPGQVDIQNLSISRFGNALQAIDMEKCNDGVRFFLKGAHAIYQLRAATKAGGWYIDELAKAFLDYISKRDAKDDIGLRGVREGFDDVGVSSSLASIAEESDPSSSTQPSPLPSLLPSSLHLTSISESTASALLNYDGKQNQNHLQGLARHASKIMTIGAVSSYEDLAHTTIYVRNIDFSKEIFGATFETGEGFTDKEGHSQVSVSATEKENSLKGGWVNRRTSALDQILADAEKKGIKGTRKTAASGAFDSVAVRASMLLKPVIAHGNFYFSRRL
jgi:hypothetical protein